MKNKVSILFMLAGILFAASLLISNILASKIMMLGSWAVPAGVLVFPIAYILNDLITEVWGFAKARFIIWTGFAVNVLAVLFFTAGIALAPAPFWDGQEAFARVLGSTPRIVAASMAAYLAGSFLNAWVMSRFKIMTQGKQFSLRAVISTLLGEGIDSAIFITIAFAGLIPLNALLMMILTQAMVKVAFEIIVLPVTARVVKVVKRADQTDTFDYKVSYNPFSFTQF